MNWKKDKGHWGIMQPSQKRIFDEESLRPEKLTNKDLIRSISFSQADIIRWICQLYCKNGIDLDCSYRIGGFYRDTGIRPRWAMDINPRNAETIPADFTCMPFKDDCFKSVMFDPPFFCITSKRSHMRFKYGSYKNIDELWTTYKKAMREIYRVLKPYGHLVFKCMDFINGRKQYLIHADIIKFAQSINFYAKDLFISISDHVAIAHNHHRQNHNRKFHCYFIVLEKKKRFIKTL